MTYLIVDLETVPDLSRWTPPADKPDAFPPVFAHRIVSAAWLCLNDAYEFGGGVNWNVTTADIRSERTLLVDLSRFISNIKPTIVSYNGRRFDCPVLVHRALLHGVQLPWYYQSRGARYRFSEEGHLDLADCLSDYGACTMATLDDVAKLCGLPGKVGVDGSQVAQLYTEGRLDEIAAYCLADVAQTALVLLRFRLIQGELKHAEYEAKRDNLIAAFKRDERLASVFGAPAIVQDPIGTAPAGADLRLAGAVPDTGLFSSEAP